MQIVSWNLWLRGGRCVQECILSRDRVSVDLSSKSCKVRLYPSADVCRLCEVCVLVETRGPPPTGARCSIVMGIRQMQNGDYSDDDVSRFASIFPSLLGYSSQYIRRNGRSGLMVGAPRYKHVGKVVLFERRAQNKGWQLKMEAVGEQVRVGKMKWRDSIENISV